MATVTPKVTRPARTRSTAPKPASTPAPPAKLEETTVVEQAPESPQVPADVAPTPEAPPVKTLPMADDGLIREGFVLEPASASKSYARFSVPEGIGCVPNKLYVPLDTVEVKVLLVRRKKA